MCARQGKSDPVRDEAVPAHRIDRRAPVGRPAFMNRPAAFCDNRPESGAVAESEGGAVCICRVDGSVRNAEMSFFIKEPGLWEAFRTSPMQVWLCPVFQRPPIRRMAT